jgi:hypothetical protein
MSTAAEALRAHREMLADVGEDIIIRRYTGTGSPRSKSDTVTRARVMGYEPKDLVGSIVQGDRKIIALVDGLAGILPITTNDKAVVRGKELAIKAVDDSTRRIAGILIALEIQASG